MITAIRIFFYLYYNRPTQTYALKGCCSSLFSPSKRTNQCIALKYSYKIDQW